MRKLKWILPAAVMVVVAAGVASSLLFFRDRWQPPTVVVIESEKMVSAMFPSYMVWQTDPEEDGRQALLLRACGGYRRVCGYRCPTADRQGSAKRGGPGA